MELKRLPIINLWDRILVPIQGDVTDDLAEQLNTEVLRAIHESGAKGLVIDLTAVWIMDSHLCAVLSNLASAARLMGTPTILSGLSPEIAMTLQSHGGRARGREDGADARAGAHDARARGAPGRGRATTTTTTRTTTTCSTTTTRKTRTTTGGRRTTAATPADRLRTGGPLGPRRASIGGRAGRAGSGAAEAARARARVYVYVYDDIDTPNAPS